MGLIVSAPPLVAGLVVLWLTEATALGRVLLTSGGISLVLTVLFWPGSVRLARRAHDGEHLRR